jgi:voltage-gated potassium channel
MTSVFRAKRGPEALDAFTRATEVPMLALAVAMVPLLVVPTVTDLPETVDRAIVASDWLIWAAFATELGAKTYLAPSRRSYLVAHWYDVVLVAVPFLRPLRVARSFRVIRLLRAGALAFRLPVTARAILTRHRLDYALATTLAVVVAGASVMPYFERNAGGSIDDFGTALWWALVTVTTVGYGDYSPVSAAGRGIAFMLMIVGIGLFGVFAANIAAFFVREVETDRDNQLLSELSALRERVERLDDLMRNRDTSAEQTRDNAAE